MGSGILRVSPQNPGGRGLDQGSTKKAPPDGGALSVRPGPPGVAPGRSRPGQLPELVLVELPTKSMPVTSSASPTVTLWAAALKSTTLTS